MPIIYIYCLYAIALFALAGWMLSFATRHYSHVDSMWSLFMLITAGTTALFLAPDLSSRASWVLFAVSVWALRLSLFITWRNWGKEDYRYETIRKNNEPHFWLKSLYIVFAFQALLAWIISYPLFAAISSDLPWQLLDLPAALLFMMGVGWETLADWQLSRFRADPHNHQGVMRQGLWRYCRHPNYFGECLVWWGFALFGVASGSHWAWLSPVLMTLLLLKVSGVGLMEQTIHQRRPGYDDYIASTNAFIPGLPKKSVLNQESES
ncbi:MAG TPA: DUF1295 domain-containing protein [Methylophilus sp.]